MISVATLVSSIRSRFDIDGFENRHDPTVLLSQISRSCMRAIEQMSDCGAQELLSVAAATTGIGATSPWEGTIVSASPTVPAERICSVQLQTNGSWGAPLRYVSQSEILDAGSQSAGTPTKWSQAPMDAVRIASGGSEIGTLRAILFPATDAAYSVRIRYVPHITLASTDSLALGSYAISWIEADVGVYLAQRDEESSPTGVLAARIAMRESARADMIKEAIHRAGIGGTRIRDTRNPPLVLE